ncbi:MAG TPA: VOC family protein [Myxococcota bacterium]
MSDVSPSRRMPRFNHVAMSVPADLLAAESRAELLHFYGEVFGWTEMPTMTQDRERLVLRVHSNEQFVFLIADAQPMACPRMDHFGLSVAAPAELYETCERARKFRERDPRVEIIEPEIEDYKVLKLHNFYVRFRLPLMVEVQCYEWAPGVGPSSLPGA